MNLKEIENPYPKDIFIEPTKTQWDLIKHALKGIVIFDAISGSLMRKGWNNAIKKVKEEIKDNIEYLEYEKEELNITGQAIKDIRIDELKNLLGDK